jgi:hypothetical protein
MLWQSAAVSGASVKSSRAGQLERAQHPQRVLRERGAGVPQDPGGEVRPPVERVDELAREGVDRDRVDREVAPGRGVGVAEAGVGLDREAAVAGAGLRLAAREAEVVLGAVRAADLDHPEAAPDDVGRPEGESARRSPSKPMPPTSMSKSLGGRPRSQSRTPPPTSRGGPRGARPRAWRAGRPGGGECRPWAASRGGSGRRGPRMRPGSSRQ